MKRIKALLFIFSFIAYIPLFAQDETIEVDDPDFDNQNPGTGGTTGGPGDDVIDVPLDGGTSLLIAAGAAAAASGYRNRKRRKKEDQNKE